MREMTDHDKYILKKVKFLERHIACVASQQTSFVSIKVIHHLTCHNINRSPMFQFNW